MPVLGAVAALAVAGVAAAQGDRSSDPLFAVLDGGYEVSTEGNMAGAGDKDGFGSATVLIKGNRQICFGMTVASISQPVAAHIHRGRAGENGPVVIPLLQPKRGDADASSGCVRASRALVADIQAHPKGYYVNVHTKDFPAGAIRGQLH